MVLHLKRIILLTSLTAFCLVSCSCETRSTKTATRAAAADKTLIYRSLVQEASRAELSAGGLLIDLGTADQHKYLLRKAAHGEERRGPGTVIRFALLVGGLQLAFHDWDGGIKAVVVRARANRKDCSLAVTMGDRSVGRQSLGTEWKVLEFPLKAPTRPGRRTVELTLEGSDAPGARAHVDKIWFRTAAADRKMSVEHTKVAVELFGDPRRALLASTPGRYSYYLTVPPRAWLTFAYAADRSTEFTVSASADGNKAVQLFSARSAGAKWRKARVNLGPLAHRLVRLDLATRAADESPHGRAAWANPEIVVQREKAPRTAAGKYKQARNLVHVMLDTARQDAFKPFNPNSPVKTPWLQKLAAEGVTFSAAYANANWTLPSVAGVLTGRYHWTISTARYVRVPTQVPLLSEHLKRHGFATAAFTANAYVSAPFGLRRGWDHYRRYHREDQRSQTPTMVTDALTWVRGQVKKKKRFYLYLHAMDPHSPYDFHEGFTARGGGARRVSIEQVPVVGGRQSPRKGEVRRLYDGEIAFFDHHLGRLLKGLESMGLSGDTLVVFSNDHGEELFDHGLLGHGTSLYEELLRSPLVMRFPGGFGKGRTVRKVVELVDLLPTQLDVLGVPLVESHGTSLVDVLQNRPDILGERYAVAQEAGRAIRYGSYKLIRTPDRDHLFNLREDPQELSDLGHKAPVARRACEVHMGEAFGTGAKARRLRGMGIRPNLPPAAGAVIGPKLKRQLEALGYVAEQGAPR